MSEKEKNILENLSANSTPKEVSDMKKELIMLIRQRNSTRSKVKNLDTQLISYANTILETYDSFDKDSPQIDYLLTMLENIADQLVKSNGGDKLEDLNDIQKKFSKNGDLLYKIYAKTLLDSREKNIPANMSETFFKRVIAHVKSEDELLTNDNFVYLLSRMGDDYNLKNPKEYQKIIEGVVMMPLMSNISGNINPRIKNNINILKIALDYTRSIANEKSEIEVMKLLTAITRTFGELIDNLDEKDRLFFNRKLEQFSAFKFTPLTKDITKYTSFNDFIKSVNPNEVSQTPKQLHIPTQSPTFSVGSKVDNVMSDDEKFKSIQELVIHLRKTNPRLTIGTVLVGYKEPFQNYILFPFEQLPYRLERIDGKQIDLKDEDNKYGTDILLSEVFGNQKGGSLYAMYKKNAMQAFGDKQTNQNRSATRAAVKSTNGTITVEHFLKYGQPGYSATVQYAVDELLQKGPTFNAKYRPAPKYMRGYKPTITTAKTSTATTKSSVVKNPTTKTLTNMTTNTTPNSTPNNNFDTFGINPNDINSAPTNILNHEYAKKVKDNIEQNYGSDIKNAPALRLLQHCIQDMFFEGKSMYEISKAHAKRYNADEKQMLMYIRAHVGAIADLDQKIVKETLIGLYDEAIEALTDKKSSLGLKLEEMKITEKDLIKNAKKTIEYFSR